MAAPLPNPSPPPRRGAAVPGVAIGIVGLIALVAGLWLALREPEPPAPRVAAVAPQAAVPAAPAPAAPAPLATPSPLAAPAAPVPLAAPSPTVAAPAPAPAPAPASAATAPPSPASPPPAPAPAVAATLPAAPATAPAPTPAPPVMPAPQAPRFDIVRVSPSGSMVIAGRAEPEATVILRANGREIGRVRADVQGQWAFAGAAPLSPGAHELTLAALDPAGREIAGAGTVEAVVAAPAPPAAMAQAPAAGAPAPATAPATAPGAPTAPIVVLTTPQGAPTLLQAPGRPAGGARLGLDIVDYDAAGDIRFAGTAPPGTTIRLYVDDAHVGDAIAGPDGRWSLAPTGAVAQGEHRLRLDQLDPAGRVAARVEQPFQRAAVAALDAGVQRVVVQPRQNLWRIARRAYGQGVRYTEIFAANRDVISDPARIYPGQVFAIPGVAAASGAPAGGSTPASASRSR